MSKDFWNERYADKNFIYGTEPNVFFKEQILKLNSGKALFLGEGEGRNAVHAATLGWLVDAVDFSSSAKEKALKLAEKKNVKINYEVCDLKEYEYNENFYDIVVMIFIHLPLDIRLNVFNKAIDSLKRGGKLIVEAFSKQQIKYNSGGPRSLDLLYSEEDLLLLSNGLNIELFEIKEIDLSEGEYHKGIANVIRLVGIKN
jgi:2-polyprenyl-3-methyl-5-hydroxy-6-metoxy-1,4-benzoquinol methylase